MNYSQINFFESKEEKVTVKDIIKKIKNHFFITKDGTILAICNDDKINFGNNNAEEVLNMGVNKMQRIEGVISDYTALRV